MRAEVRVGVWVQPKLGSYDHPSARWYTGRPPLSVPHWRPRHLAAPSTAPLASRAPAGVANRWARVAKGWVRVAS